MRFNQDPVTTKGVTERAFELECEGRVVPGIVWTPERVEGPRPLVLIGHGGSGHKREPHILGLARRLVRHDGIAAAAIDGPMHGDRKAEVSPEEMRRRMQSSDSRSIATGQMVSDWKATLDALQKLPEIGVAPVGYWGLSMGTMFGLPFVAAEPRIAAAVLGLMGVGGRYAAADGPLATAAPEVRCPVLFLQQWHDELIARDHASALFDAIAAEDKRLHANPGAHSAVPREEFLFTQQFLTERLLARG